MPAPADGRVKGLSRVPCLSRVRCVVFFPLAVFLVLYLAFASLPRAQRPRLLQLAGAHARAAVMETSSRPSSLAFVSYTPSAWEEDWWVHAEEWKSKECDVLSTPPHVNYMQQWLDASLPSTLIRSAAEVRAPVVVPESFSTLRYRGASGAEVDVRIEPLAGILRDPRLPCATDLGKTFWLPHDENIQSKEFIYLHAPLFRDVAALNFSRRRVFLFDLGASTYNDPNMPGLSWLYPRYANEGLELTDLYAWELRPKAGNEFFAGMPLALSAATHFYNFGVDMSREDAANPLAVLKRVARPEDYVIFKLDIDVTQIEEALVEALLRDPEALALIDDFFWEHHVAIKSMEYWWVIAEGEGVKKTMRYLRALRYHGVRAHAWP